MTVPQSLAPCLIEASGVPLCIPEIQDQILKIRLPYQPFARLLQRRGRVLPAAFAYFLGSAICGLASAFAGYRCLQPTGDDRLRWRADET
jgi:hypothetical protein